MTALRCKPAIGRMAETSQLRTLLGSDICEVKKMQRWSWFLAADYQGEWITTGGYAEVSFKKQGFTASLRFSADTDVYQFIEATISEEFVDAHVTSPDPTVPAYQLAGPLFEGAKIGEVASKSMVLTDGTTVLGLAYGPRSIAESP